MYARKRSDLLPLVQIRERWDIFRVGYPLDQFHNAIRDLGGIHRIIGIVEHRNA